MSARSIHGDSWHGALNDGWHFDHPSWDDVENAIVRLDAKTYTLVTIQGVGEQHMGIGGGAGHYVVYATFDGNDFWNLLNSETKDGLVLLNAGGQEGEYSRKQVLDLQSVLIAARAFFSDSRLDSGLQWERQS